jgi:hypothetical protein
MSSQQERDRSEEGGDHEHDAPYGEGRERVVGGSPHGSANVMRMSSTCSPALRRRRAPAVARPPSPECRPSRMRTPLLMGTGLDLFGEPLNSGCALGRVCTEPADFSNARTPELKRLRDRIRMPRRTPATTRDEGHERSTYAVMDRRCSERASSDRRSRRGRR